MCEGFLCKRFQCFRLLLVLAWGPHLLFIRAELGLEGNLFTFQYQSCNSPEIEASKMMKIIFSCTLALYQVRWVLAIATVTISGPRGILWGHSHK